MLSIVFGVSVCCLLTSNGMADKLVKAIAAETGWTFAEEDVESRDQQ